MPKVLGVVLQSCPALCDPMGYSPPGFSIHRILQARILDWVVMSYFRLWRVGLDWVINIFKVLWLKICNFAFGTITGFIVILFFLKIHIGVEFSWILYLLQTHALSSLWNTWIFVIFFQCYRKKGSSKPHSLVIWKNSARQMTIRIFLSSLPAFFSFSFLNL